MIASYRFVLFTGGPDYRQIAPFLSFLSWLPAAVIPIFRPTMTPPYDLFALYVFQLITGVFCFGSIVYYRDTVGIKVNGWDVGGAVANLVVVLALMVIVLRMPLSLPRNKMVGERIVSWGVSVNDREGFNVFPGSASESRGLHALVGMDHV